VLGSAGAWVVGNFGARARRATQSRRVVVGLVVVLLFVAVLALDLGSPLNRTDETWLWWITHRVLAGDVLYRDVYCVTTPLAVWSTVAAAAVAGPQLVVLRVIVVAAFVAEILLALSITRRCGVGRRGRILVVLGCVVVGSPLVVNNALYTTLAIVFTLAAFRWLLVWQVVPTVPGRGQGCIR
jgi:hypothetical protein